MIKLYSTKCPKCIVLEKKLSQKGINFELVEDATIMIEKGFMSAPVLEVNGQVMNFMEANKWVNEQG